MKKAARDEFVKTKSKEEAKGNKDSSKGKGKGGNSKNVEDMEKQIVEKAKVQSILNREKDKTGKTVYFQIDN